MYISLKKNTEKVVLLQVKGLISCGPVAFRCDHFLTEGISKLFWKKFMQYILTAIIYVLAKH